MFEENAFIQRTCHGGIACELDGVTEFVVRTTAWGAVYNDGVCFRCATIYITLMMTPEKFPKRTAEVLGVRVLTDVEKRIVQYG